MGLRVEEVTEDDGGRNTVLAVSGERTSSRADNGPHQIAKGQRERPELRTGLVDSVRHRYRVLAGELDQLRPGLVAVGIRASSSWLITGACGRARQAPAACGQSRARFPRELARPPPVQVAGHSDLLDPSLGYSAGAPQHISSTAGIHESTSCC